MSSIDCRVGMFLDDEIVPEKRPLSWYDFVIQKKKGIFKFEMMQFGWLRNVLRQNFIQKRHYFSLFRIR